MEAMLKNLKTAIFDVMETMFFLIPDVDELPPGEEQNIDMCSIHIGIKGDQPYLLTFVFDKRLAGTMAVDFLGIDESEVDTMIIQKCLKETANIYAGKLLLSFEGQHNSNITLPFSRKDEVFGQYETLDTGTLSLSFDGYCLNALIEKIKTVS